MAGQYGPLTFFSSSGCSLLLVIISIIENLEFNSFSRSDIRKTVVRPVIRCMPSVCRGVWVLCWRGSVVRYSSPKAVESINAGGWPHASSGIIEHVGFYACVLEDIPSLPPLALSLKAIVMGRRVRTIQLSAVRSRTHTYTQHCI